MSLALNRLGASALRGSCRVCARPRRPTVPFRSTRRQLHPSYVRRDDGKAKLPAVEVPGGKDKEPTSAAEPTGQPAADAVNDLDSTELPVNPPDNLQAPVATTAPPSLDLDEPFHTTGGIATPEQEARFQAFLDDPPSEYASTVETFKLEMEEMEQTFAATIERDRPPEIRDPDAVRQKLGLMAMDEEDEAEDADDEPFEGDDISSLGHGELEQHREIREYMRIAAWEMPMLHQFAKEFKPPTDTPLRFRYTNYMGETHPAENKVVLEFCTSDLPLTNAQRLKLVKLVGVRYDPQTDIVKMSCEMFTTIAQNKRYLGDLVDTLMMTAKGEGEMQGAKDSFEDMPVDFRHVKWKTKPEFPEEWKLTKRKKSELQKRRLERQKKERLRLEEGKLVDGVGIIDSAARAHMTTSSQRLGQGAPVPARKVDFSDLV